MPKKRYPKRRVVSAFRENYPYYMLKLSCGHEKLAERMYCRPKMTTCYKCPPKERED